MPEIKKIRIVVASVLKPVDDTRAFEKIGHTLNGTGLFEVHIFGFPSTQPLADTNITLHPSKPFKRISLARVIQPFKVLWSIINLKPSKIIIGTHELLVVAVVSKLLLKKVYVIYDLQENYFLNILHTNAFPAWLKPLLAFYVRSKEIMFSFCVDFFLLAEKTYVDELAFTQGKCMVLENKVTKPPVEFLRPKNKTGEFIKILFSGTLAETTGIFKAIRLTKLLHAAEPSIRLTIIGQSPKPSVLKIIKDQLKGHDFITLLGDGGLVPHRTILAEIEKSDFGFISYTPSRATANKIPTKLYEYMGYRLPILLTDHTPWVAFCSPYCACIAIDFNKPDVTQILHQLKNSTFYTPPPHDVFWEAEAEKLIAILEKP